MKKRTVLFLIIASGISLLCLLGFLAWEWTEPMRWPHKEIHTLCMEAHNFVPRQEHLGAEAAHETAKKIAVILDRSPSDANVRDRWGRTPLHYAARKEYAQLLIERGAEVNVRDEEQQTPLHVAARWARVDVVQVLLAHGADINAKDRQGFTPLFLAHAAVQRRTSEQFGDPDVAEADDAHEKRRAETISLLENKGGIIDEESFRKVIEDNIKRAKQQRE
jgi:ankyrin repeat protein